MGLFPFQATKKTPAVCCAGVVPLCLSKKEPCATLLPHMSLTTTDKPGFSTGTVGLPHGFPCRLLPQVTTTIAHSKRPSTPHVTFLHKSNNCSVRNSPTTFALCGGSHRPHTPMKAVAGPHPWGALPQFLKEKASLRKGRLRRSTARKVLRRFPDIPVFPDAPDIPDFCGAPAPFFSKQFLP